MISSLRAAYTYVSYVYKICIFTIFSQSTTPCQNYSELLMLRSTQLCCRYKSKNYDKMIYFPQYITKISKQPSCLIYINTSMLRSLYIDNLEMLFFRVSKLLLSISCHRKHIIWHIIIIVSTLSDHCLPL